MSSESNPPVPSAVPASNRQSAATLLLGHSLVAAGVAAGVAEGETEPASLPPHALLRHVMALGSSGSGKTVFCKGIVEEFVRAGLPAICVDPQGDLASLALASGDPASLIAQGLDPALAQAFNERADVVVFTPASRKGVPLCVDPLRIDTVGLNNRDTAQATSAMATMLVGLLGYDLSHDDADGLVAVFDLALGNYRNFAVQPGQPAQPDQPDQPQPVTLESFSAWFQTIAPDDRAQYERYVSAKVIGQASRRLARLDVGVRRHLFHDGMALNIDVLLGRGPHAALPDGRTRLSVIYLNTLQSQEDKAFVLAALCEQLYTWMLANPSSTPQALFYVDEVAPFVPPVRKPACKPALSLLLKQARKYGVCCMMATQNPGDVDYKALAQFGTWSIGRLTTRQDLRKIEPTIKSLDPDNADEIMGRLPALGPGEFMLLSPDNFAKTTPIRARWLYTEHQTLDEDAIEILADERWRERFDEQPALADQSQAGGVARARPRKKTASAAGTARPKAQPASLADQADANAAPERILANLISATAREFGQAAGTGDAAARRTLQRLEAAGLAASYKDGRSNRYFAHSTGLRPDLGLTSKVLTLARKVGREQAQTIATGKAEQAVLGLFGDGESLSGLAEEHLLVLRVTFRERVPRSFLRRLFGPSHDQREDSVYLHPRTMKLVAYDPEIGIWLAEQVTKHASDLPDFDGRCAFIESLPAKLNFDAGDWLERPAERSVLDHFKQQFDATPIAVEPVFVPIWRLRFSRRRQGGERLMAVDGLCGKVLDWA